MSSTNKTEIGLNLWLGGDKPKREDFCNDNLIIDKQIIDHKNDMSSTCLRRKETNGIRMFIAIFIMAIMKVFVKLQPLAHLIRAQLLFFRQALPLTFGMRQIAKTIFIRLTALPLVLQTVCVLEMTEKLLKFLKTLRVL